MSTDAFHKKLEEDAARFQANVTNDYAKKFADLSSARIPHARAHFAFAALDAYLMLAVDVYGRRGAVFGYKREPSAIVLSRGSQTVGCSHYLNDAAIGIKYQGLHPDGWEGVPFDLVVEGGWPSTVDVWRPIGNGVTPDLHEIEDKVQRIVKFLLASH